MPQKIILLTGKREAPFLEQFIVERRSTIEVITATTKAEFQNVIQGDLMGTRLVSFCNRVIVPEEVLNRLNLESYNIHPGSKHYPGVCPEAFAIADGATNFGATAHVMTANVDDGPIVATKKISIPENIGRLDLAALAYNEAVQLFAEVAEFCIENDGQMLRTGDKWHGHTNRQAEYVALLKAHPELVVDNPSDQ
jgi:methionyl-tRNA formyltransferase